MKKFPKSLVKKMNKRSDFNAVWKKRDEYIPVFYKGYELQSLVGDMPIIPRELGYDLPIKEIFLTGLEIMSGENEPNDFNKVYHNNFYSIIKPLSNRKVKVRIKYYTIPDNLNSIDETDYLSKVKNVVDADPELVIIKQPYGKEENDLFLTPNGFRIRQNMGISFYFETILYSDTYGELLLQIDEIVAKIEKQI